MTNCDSIQVELCKQFIQEAAKTTTNRRQLYFNQAVPTIIGDPGEREMVVRSSTLNPYTITPYSFSSPAAEVLPSMSLRIEQNPIDFLNDSTAFMTFSPPPQPRNSVIQPKDRLTELDLRITNAHMVLLKRAMTLPSEIRSLSETTFTSAVSPPVDSQPCLPFSITDPIVPDTLPTPPPPLLPVSLKNWRSTQRILESDTATDDNTGTDQSEDMELCDTGFGRATPGKRRQYNPLPIEVKESETYKIYRERNAKAVAKCRERKKKTEKEREQMMRDLIAKMEELEQRLKTSNETNQKLRQLIAFMECTPSAVASCSSSLMRSSIEPSSPL